jgi:hypothetical protein
MTRAFVASEIRRLTPATKWYRLQVVSPRRAGERAAGKSMRICVSRAVTPRPVLDLCRRRHQTALAMA